MTLPLAGRVALVTGASRGIGRGIAERLAQDGADVVVDYESVAEAQDARACGAAIERAGRRSLAVEADVTQARAVGHLVQQALEAFGHLDILVNNAGIAPFKAFLDLDEATWDRTLGVNLKAAYLCSRAAARSMVEGGWGRIVNITSTASVVAIPQLAHYCASKAGLAMLTRALAVELGPHGITVNAVGPSTVKTRLNEDVLARGDMERREAELNPTRRIGTPADIAGTVAFLTRDEASWVNGQNIIVDGGLTALSPQPPYDTGSG